MDEQLINLAEDAIRKADRDLYISTFIATIAILNLPMGWATLVVFAGAAGIGLSSATNSLRLERALWQYRNSYRGDLP